MNRIQIKTDPVWKEKVLPKDTAKLFTLSIVSIFINYYVPFPIIKNIWFLSLLFFYIKSYDEAFWLALMLVFNDGFAGFFGIRGVQLTGLGLPDFEYGHIYILAAIYKLLKRKEKISIFYNRWMLVLYLFVFFLVIRGFLEGIPGEYNIYLRTIRYIFPLTLFYLVPRLLTVQGEYERLFSFVFLIALVAFFTQIISILTGTNPMVLVGLKEGVIIEDLTEITWRGLYNVGINILAFFAALFYLAARKAVFPRIYLQIILVAVYANIFLSATRGWIVGLGISFVLFSLFVQKINLKRILGLLIILIVGLQILTLNTSIHIQLDNAIKRTKTLEAVAKGDLSAGGTASRFTEQGPKVMSVWKNSPIVGWGFSDVYYKNYNPHVGNQTVLLHSGILGFALLTLFAAFFFLKLIFLSIRTKKFGEYSLSLLVFPIFFLGWFFIHSTSGQHFGYTTGFIFAIPQSVFFAFGATLYRSIKAKWKWQKYQQAYSY